MRAQAYAYHHGCFLLVGSTWRTPGRYGTAIALRSDSVLVSRRPAACMCSATGSGRMSILLLDRTLRRPDHGLEQFALLFDHLGLALDNRLARIGIGRF